jgi:NAD-dependent deacetylase
LRWPRAAKRRLVWESIDPAVLRRCQNAGECDVFLSVGTSSVVYPAAGLVLEAKRRGAYTVEINPAPTEASTAVDLAIPQPAEIALPAIDALVCEAP